MNNPVRFVCLGLSLVVLGRAQAFGSTATLRLTSPRHGSQVPPGAVIPWTITVKLSAGDSAGLALALVDLVQGEGNPGKLDLPPADGVPAGLERFSLPLGISNPGENGSSTGYAGLVRGRAGERNLVQIGGAQNTFGKPGAEMGKQATVVTGLALGRELVLAQGSFRAPQAGGVYRFTLENAAASVLVRLEAARGHWRVEAAGVDVNSTGITFTVAGGTAPTFVRGDANQDGTINISDASTVLGFLFLGAPSHLACEASADCDASGEILLNDAVYLLNYLFLGGRPPIAPFPACGRDTQPNALSCEAFVSCP